MRIISGWHISCVVLFFWSLFFAPAAKTTAAGAPEGTAAATSDKALRLGQCGQAASGYQVSAGDPERGSATDETAEGTAAAATTTATATAAAATTTATAAAAATLNCFPAKPHTEPSGELHTSFEAAYSYSALKSVCQMYVRGSHGSLEGLDVNLRS